MFFFKDRKRLADLFEKWCDEENATYSILNVIAFLQIHELLNVEKCEDFLSREKEGENGK